MAVRIVPIVAIVVFLVVIAMIGAASHTGCGGDVVILPIPNRPDYFFNLDRFTRVSVHFDGTVYINGQFVTHKELPNSLPRNSYGIKLFADARLPYGKVKTVLASVASTQPKRIIIMTESQVSPIDRMGSGEAKD